VHFEYIYFARPDSVVGGRSVYQIRRRLGMELAGEAPAAADVVVPVPDSGVPAAIGYAQAAGIPYEMGIIRNHYVGRTFIEPTQSIRELGVRLKHNANRSVVAGKRIVLIDDSLVRGTTSVKIVRMMREAGAAEVHFRIASPPITHPDFYGIDTPSATSCSPPITPSRRCARSSARIRSPSCRSKASTAPWARSAATRCAAIHRPLLHRRLSDPAHRPRRHRAATAFAAGGGELRGREIDIRACSPHGAQRNAGPVFPDFAALNPGYEATLLLLISRKRCRQAEADDSVPLM